tara:strand:+ start:779 stop:1729 length:951 start_codon:yes stop_codon:yes gene_type:complete
LSAVVALFIFLFLNISISFAQPNDECEGDACNTLKPTVVWVRPPELGVKGPGIAITSGPVYNVMAHLSGYLDNYNHEFEAYPVKRAWSLIQHEKSAQRVYCFYGASYQEERTKWGYYSLPTSINLPLLIVSKRELLPLKSNQDNHGTEKKGKGQLPSISLQALLNQHFKTVLYNDVSNAYASAVEQWATKYNVLRVNSLGKDLGMHTIALIKSGRVDFGYVGPRELAALSKDELNDLHVYQLSELSTGLRGTKRLLCSKTELGREVTTGLNNALRLILSQPDKSKILRDTQFIADGYSKRLKPLFDERWDAYMSKK